MPLIRATSTSAELRAEPLPEGAPGSPACDKESRVACCHRNWQAKLCRESFFRHFLGRSVRPPYPVGLETLENQPPGREELQCQTVGPVLGFEFPLPFDFAVGRSLQQMDVGPELQAAEQCSQAFVDC